MKAATATSSSTSSYYMTITPSRIVVSRAFNSIPLTNVVFEKVEKLKPISTGGLDLYPSENLINYYHRFTGGDSSPESLAAHLNVEVSKSGSIDSYSTLFPEMDEPLVQVLRWVFVGVYIILFVLGMSNVLALFIVSRFKKMRTVTNTFIFNLCLADLIYVTFLPFIITFRIQRTWIFGDVICKLFSVADSTAKYASIYFVCVLSVDRYLALCYPTWCKQHRKVSLAVMLSIFGWCLTAALMTPIFLYSGVIPIDPNHTVKICGVRWPDGDLKSEPSYLNLNRSTNNDTILSSPMNKFRYEHYWTIYSFVFCFALPTVVILFFYFKVFEQLLQASDRAERLKRRREQSYRKVTRMVLVMVAFYFVCWSPYWIMHFVNTFVVTTVNTAFLRISFNILHTLPYLNCAVNPVIYGLLTQTFKKILVDMFPCCKCLAKPGGKHSPTKSVTRSRLGDDMPMHSDLDHHHHNHIVHQELNHHRHRPFGHHRLDDEDEDSIRFIRSSISNSVQMVSNLCLNLLAKHEHCNGLGDSNGKLNNDHSTTTICTTENGKGAQEV